MDSKSIFKSKTFWANALGPLFLWLAAKGVDLSPDDQAALITVVMMIVNIVLRSITRQPVHVVTPSAMIVLPALAFALMALSACASNTAPPASGPSTASSSPAQQQFANGIAKLQAFAATDLTNAEAIATANNDAVAAPCFPALQKFLASIPSASTLGNVSGGFSGFEQARTLRLQGQTIATAGVPDYLKIACAPLVLDEQTFWVKMFALAGVSVAAAPLLPAALPAVGAGLPVALP